MVVAGKFSLEGGGWGLSLLGLLRCGSQKGSPSASHNFFFFAHIRFLNFIYFFICGCAGSLLLYRLSPVTVSRRSY